jgi:hypothetical protein
VFYSRSICEVLSITFGERPGGRGVARRRSFAAICSLKRSPPMAQPVGAVRGALSAAARCTTAYELNGVIDDG